MPLSFGMAPCLKIVSSKMLTRHKQKLEQTFTMCACICLCDYMCFSTSLDMLIVYVLQYFTRYVKSICAAVTSLDMLILYVLQYFTRYVNIICASVLH